MYKGLTNEDCNINVVRQKARDAPFAGEEDAVSGEQDDQEQRD